MTDFFLYIINAELLGLLLPDPVEHISAAAVLHHNTQKVISCTNTHHMVKWSTHKTGKLGYDYLTVVGRNEHAA